MPVAFPIPAIHLLDFALEMGVPIYPNQLKNLLDELDVKNALSVRPVKIPDGFLGKEIQTVDSELNKVFAFLYNYNSVIEQAKLDRVKIRNEIVRIKKIQQDFQQHLADEHKQAFLKKFWDSIEDDYKEQQLKLLIDQKFPEMKKHYKILTEMIIYGKKLKELDTKITESTNALVKVLDNRVNETVKIFDNERQDYLQLVTQENETIGDQLLEEHRDFMALQQRLNHLETANVQPNLVQIQELKEAVQEKANKIKTNQSIYKLNEEFVNEQNQIASDQKIIRQNSRQVLKEITGESSQYDRSAIATKAIFVTAIQHMKALKDRSDHHLKKDFLSGKSNVKPASSADNVLSPEKLSTQLNAQLNKVINIDLEEEKKQKMIIKNIRMQCDDVTKKINDLIVELDALEGKIVTEPAGKMQNKEESNKNKK